MRNAYDQSQCQQVLKVYNNSQWMLNQNNYFLEYDIPIFNKIPNTKKIQTKPKENIFNHKTNYKDKNIVEIYDSNTTPLYCIDWLKCKYMNEDFDHLKKQYEKLLLIKPEQYIDYQIEKDLKRTLLAENKIKEIKNILLAYSIFDPSIGYIQGMNYIVSVLYSHAKQEWIGFWLFVLLIEQLEIRDMYQMSQNSLNKYSQILDFYICRCQYKLYINLKDKQVQTQLYIQQWILSLLLQQIPFEYSQMYLNGLFNKGLSYFYTVAVTFIKMFEQTIIEEEQIEILMILTQKQNKLLNWPFILSIDWDIEKQDIRVIIESFDSEQNIFQISRLQTHQSQQITHFIQFIKQ
ncbi:unnamed protein product [Paramecium pentaurelia]|uniref:Rab-GAP TBC domain-containing protein n=1 Tax=Paramecium pentaurelia TaxID=43138 RepID=A0A8S1XE87_9CILI|nr:unnamed protein product [Paramecium pentaurelia]